MSRLVHLGSTLVDFIYDVGALPPAGGESIAPRFRQSIGGGFITMRAAQAAGLPVAYGGPHGTGPAGDLLRSTFAAYDIPLLLPPAREADTGNCVVLVTPDAERTFVSWPGVEGVAGVALPAADAFGPGDWIVLTGYMLRYPGSRDAFPDWIERLPIGTPFIFDPSPVLNEITPAVLSRVLARSTWLSCSAAEATFLAGSGEPAAQAERILARICPHAAGVVVRSGAAGCLVALRDGPATVAAAFTIAAVNTNGAGDTHIGAFIGRLAQGAAPSEAARYANAAAALWVSRHGGITAPDAEVRAARRSWLRAALSAVTFRC